MPTKKKKHPSPAKPVSPDTAKRAFDEVKKDIDAVGTAQLVPINLDIPTAVSIILGAAPNVESLRDAVTKELPKFPVANVDRLRTYALAAWYAHLVAIDTGPTPDDKTFQAMLDEATALRRALLVGAEALADRGLVSGERIAEIRAGSGHIDTANDLVALAATFAEAWNDVEQKTAIERAEIDRAAQLGPALLVGLSSRRQGADPLPSTTDPQRVRERAFSLLFHAYDECRRAVAYLRWAEGDADAFAPSPFTKRRRRTSPSTTDEANALEPAPSSDLPSTVLQPLPPA